MKGLLREDSDGVLRFIPWLGYGWLQHGFGTRRSEKWNLRGDWIGLSQTHSDICVLADGSRHGRIGRGDALLTQVPLTPVSVRTADCVPILMLDPGRRAIAAVHSGWRGAAAGIAAKAVAAMIRHFGSRPEDLQAVLGPAIGPCCYEVGPEVAAQFQNLFPERSDLTGKAMLDLGEACRRQLLSAGLSQDCVWSAGMCTRCLALRFHSFRRDGEEAGRMVSGMAIGT